MKFTFTFTLGVGRTIQYPLHTLKGMNQRTIVRSCTTKDGTLVAMNDGLVAWKPKDGRPSRIKLDALPTVLLAIKGPMGPVDSIAIGTAEGEVMVLTIPRLETVASFQLNSGSVRALCLLNEGEMKFLVGTQHGAVWYLGKEGAERCHHAFSIEGPVSSLHLEGDLVHVRSGWIHHVRTLDGVAQVEENTAANYTARPQKRLGQTYFQPYPA